MESFELDCGGRCRESFETDEFYETLQAPKFHDFTVPEEEPAIDPEAWFNGTNPGVIKKVVAAAGATEVVSSGLQNPKFHKGVDSKTADVHSSLPGSLHQVPSKIPAPEKGVSTAGGGKIPKGSVTVSVSPLMTKSLRNGNNVHSNPSSQPIVVEKLTEALKSMSMATPWQPSENDDPNPATGNSRNSPAVTPSKPGKHSRIKPPAVLSEALVVSCTTNLKNAETTLPSSGPQITIPVHKETVVLSDGLADGASNILEHGNLKACDTVLSSKKDTPGKGAGIAAAKPLKSKLGEARSSPATFHHSTSQQPSTTAVPAAICKTPVKEPTPKVSEACSEHVKVAACNAVTASPYSGHHCRSSRCAANDPNYNSPASIPRKKYLMARQGVPGSRMLFHFDRTKEDQEAGKVQNDLQQKGDPSDICNMSEVKVLTDNNPEEVVDVTTDLFVDKKDTAVQQEVSEESIRSQSAQLGQGFPESCNPTDIQHLEGHEERILKDNDPEEVVAVAADLFFDEKVMVVQESLDKQHAVVVQEEIADESIMLQSALLVQGSQESCNPTDIQHLVGQQEERERLLFEQLVQELQESCNPEVKTDFHSGDGHIDSGEACSGEDGTCNPEVETKALVPESETLFGESIKYAPSAPEGPQYFEDLSTIPSPEGTEKGGLMSQEGEAEQQQPTMSLVSQSGRKRKSQELGDEVGSKKADDSLQMSSHHSKTHRKEALCACTTYLQKKTTNPRPFRLRTQERGALKELEFNKKVEEYLAAREGFHSAFQGLAVLGTRVEGKPLQQGINDPSSQPNHLVFGANQADFAEQQVQEKQDPAKRHKQILIHTQKMPAFDHPFKPHRSTKKLTVPQEFKFHAINGTRTCTLHSR
ncbi:unnamed protein product [Sphagnum troendelagicum]|uniref:TPX2 central domain-containing protein n=1 Tax=Sphagnum troendelagicum TaxID=128251 RepID=A0ABP0T8U7_9BRYO